MQKVHSRLKWAHLAGNGSTSFSYKLFKSPRKGDLIKEDVDDEDNEHNENDNNR